MRASRSASFNWPSTFSVGGLVDHTTTLTSTNDRGESPLLGLMRDQYGNYVIRKFNTVTRAEKGLDLLDEGFTLGIFQLAQHFFCWRVSRAHNELIEQIKPLLSQLKKFSYGKQIVAIEKLIFDPNSPSASFNWPSTFSVGGLVEHTTSDGIELTNDIVAIP
jgi:hypothetical protein